MSQVFILKSEILRPKAGINEYSVGWAKVVFLTITREPIKSSKHLIPVRRCNWLIAGDMMYFVLTIKRETLIVKSVYRPMEM